MNNPNLTDSSIKIIRPISGWQIIDFKELKEYKDLFYFMVWREIKVLYAQTILGIPIKDLTSGFKCFNKRVLESIDLDNIQSDGYSFQIELTYKALNSGFKIKEIPITFSERKLGISKFSKNIFWEAAFLVWKLRFEKK